MANFPADFYIFCDVELRNQHKLLMDHPDAVGDGHSRICHFDSLAVNADSPAVCCIKTIQKAHESTFPSTILANNSMDLSLLDLEICMVHCQHLGESLDHLKHFNCIGCLLAVLHLMRLLYCFTVLPYSIALL